MVIARMPYTTRSLRSSASSFDAREARSRPYEGEFVHFVVTMERGRQHAGFPTLLHGIDVMTTRQAVRGCPDDRIVGKSPKQVTIIDTEDAERAHCEKHAADDHGEDSANYHVDAVTRPASGCRRREPSIPDYRDDSHQRHDRRDGPVHASPRQ